MNAIVTDFGVVAFGPKMRKYWEREVAPGLAMPKRTSKYKQAAQAAKMLEQSVSVLAEVYWHNGAVLEKTP